MKIRIISLFLSLAFLSIITFEHISNKVLLESSSSNTVEYILEKRLYDKFITQSYLSSLTAQAVNITKSIIHIFKQSFYTFKSINKIFKPPIYLY